MQAWCRRAGLRIKSSLLEGWSSVRHFYYQLHHEVHFGTILWVAKILVPGFSSDFRDHVKPRGADAVGQLISWRVSPRLLFQWQRVSGPGEYAIPTESLKLAIGMMDRKRSTAHSTFVMSPSLMFSLDRVLFDSNSWRDQSSEQGVDTDACNRKEYVGLQWEPQFPYFFSLNNLEADHVALCKKWNCCLLSYYFLTRVLFILFILFIKFYDLVVKMINI